MKIFFKLLIAVVSALMLIWGITSLAALLQRGGDYVPFTLYSEVVGEFVSLDNSGENGSRYYDYAGREYTESEFDSVLPSFYFRQLVMDGRLPDSINGVAVSPSMLEEQSFIFISHPSSINCHITPLYFLLESMSKRVYLEMPSDVFRLGKKGIEFIDMSRNEVDRAKSALFQQALDTKGVTFPITLVAGNATTKKPYDHGYLLLDATGRLFNLRQTVGRPYLKEIALPNGVEPQQLFVTEYPSRAFLGFLADKAGQFYAITLPDYRLVKAELPPLDLTRDKLTIFGNPFYWTVIRSRDGEALYTALEAGSLRRVKELRFEASEESSIARYLVPFQLSFTSPLHGYFRPEVHHFSWIGLLVWLVVGGVWVSVSRARQWQSSSSKSQK
ncbi:Uncharacterised protein [Chlamydia trachomatis]|nr:Uncharacterised protein [Chlamydia trachomatis]